MTIRILLESTVQLNRIIFIFYLPFFTVLYGWLFLFLLIYSKADATYYNFSSDYTSVDGFELAIFYFQTFKAFTGLLFIFLPFRLLTLISWNKSSRIFTIFFVMIFRVLPTFALFSVLTLFIGMFVLVAFWLIYQWDLPQMADFGSAITNFMLVSASDVMSSDPFIRSLPFDTSRYIYWGNTLHCDRVLFWVRDHHDYRFNSTISFNRDE